MITDMNQGVYSEKFKFALFVLQRAINNGRGFYFLIGPSEMQEQVINILNSSNSNIAIHDFAKQGKELIEIANLKESNTNSRVLVYLHFQEAFINEFAEWNIDVVRRLDFSRNPLTRAVHSNNLVMIFCMTPELDTLLCRRAPNFYDYVVSKINLN